MLQRFLPICLFLTAVQLLPAQQQDPNFCGYTGISPWLMWYSDHRNEFQSRGGDTAWLYVPVTIHIVGNNSGIGYYPQEQCMRIICEMNEQYTDARIHFYFYPGEPFVYHNNSNWYNHDWDGGAEMLGSTQLPDRVNAYVVADPAGNCGYSWYDAIVMGKGCSGSGNATWAHEMGHHLSLPHPFYGWENFNWNYSQPAPEEIFGYSVEKTDSSNCYVSGDRFCDTRPDYLNFRWSCDGNQQSVQTQKDPNGVSFRSDASLYMGYSLDVCSSRFTPEQIAAMRANLHTEHAAYLQEETAGAAIPADAVLTLLSPIDTQQAQYNNVVFQWEPVPNATFYAVQVALQPTFSFYLFNGMAYNTTTLTATKGIPNNRVLYWRVRAYNEWNTCISENVTATGVFKTKNLTATNDLERVALVSLSPNPVAAGIPAKLSIFNDEKLDLNVSLTDVAGNQLYRNSVRLSSGENEIEIPTDNLSAGFYVLTLQGEKGAIVRRLVVTE